MQGYIGVRFLLNHGAFLSVAMSEEHARQIVEVFPINGYPKYITDKNFPPPPGHATKWWVLTSTIQAVHTHPIEMQPTGGTQYVSGIPVNR